jgi:hypothetical protein
LWAAELLAHLPLGQAGILAHRAEEPGHRGIAGMMLGLSRHGQSMLCPNFLDTSCVSGENGEMMGGGRPQGVATKLQCPHPPASSSAC